MEKARLGFEPLEERIALSTNYYVAPTGSDLDAGTLTQPFATIQRAYSAMAAGDTAFFRGGVYDITSRITLEGKSGQAGNLLNFVPYQEEQPIFDFTTAAGNGTVPSGSFFRVRNINYVHMDGFELRKNGSDPNEGRRDAITFRNVDFSTIDNLNVHNFAGSGIQVIGGSHDNLIENNDVHDNVVNNNSNADGYWIGDGSHDNIVRGNRAYHNNDDGFDTWEAGSGNLLENNWAFENGKDANGNVINGDGNGFKLGRGFGQNTIVNNLSWNNKFGGFTDNSNSAVLTVYNNTSYKNGDGWFFGSPAQDILRNNISYLENNHFSGADDQFNSWNLPVFVGFQDFVTLDDSANRGPRQADNSLPVSEFLHLVAGSDLLDRGTDVGLPFNGTAPDLGAFELRVEPPSADFDGDNIIDGGDFLAWQRGFGTPEPNANKSDGDADNDLDVDGVDLDIWQSQFGTVSVSALALPLTEANSSTASVTTTDPQVPIQTTSAVQSQEELASSIVGMLIHESMLRSEVEASRRAELHSVASSLVVESPNALPHDVYFSQLKSSNDSTLPSEASLASRDDASTAVFDELGGGVDIDLPERMFHIEV